MATINLEVDKTYYYDPEGPNAPLTMLFPDSANLVDGSKINIINQSVSQVSATLQAQGADTIANPEEITEFATSHIVTTPELLASYILKGTQWRMLHHGNPDLAKQSLATFAFATYGGLSLSAPIASGDIGPTWDKIDVFDQTRYATPRWITQNIANSSLNLAYPGVNQVAILLNYSHNESNSSRVTYIRLFNETDSIAGEPIEIPISRNQPATLISLVVDSEMLDGKDYILQIGNGDTITTVTTRAAYFSISGIGEFRGDLNNII